jgi:uncharacterized protein DUF7003
MGQAIYRVGDIQRQLDECAKQSQFPMLDNAEVYLAGVRLHAYRDETRWAIIIEQLGFLPQSGGHAGIVNCLYRFGNCLKRPPGLEDTDLLTFTADGKSGPTFHDDTGLVVRDGASSIRMRSNDLAMNLSPAMLKQAGVVLKDPTHVKTFEMLRTLIVRYQDFMMATEDELRNRVPADLEETLVLDEWHHPDLGRGQLPSSAPTFRMIAKVLVAGDPVFYQPTEQPNTHWKNWPAGGTL